ncbi:hypothetical protein B5U98_08035 [Bosea sp. Tri-39]|nr:hypothetical protein BLM15_28815 [Bosea sp. Tri-49]RXT24911.1 hypothetical protein B5U98_08035 [Bosea sp. Tri-39]RXT33463.1 hypothetical protein B5U99_18465 [Bosea sp. Tri-54]
MALGEYAHHAAFALSNSRCVVNPRMIVNSWPFVASRRVVLLEFGIRRRLEDLGADDLVSVACRLLVQRSLGAHDLVGVAGGVLVAHLVPL